MKKQIRINDEETKSLQALAAMVPENGVILEIGAAWGWSIRKMAEASRESVKLYTIDIWTLGPQKQQASREKRFHSMIAPYRQRITPIKAYSQEVDWERDIDLLFIDGNHHYQYVLGDYLKFSPFVKHGGYLVFHDYHEGRAPDVTRVIEESVEPTGLWTWRINKRLWMGKRVSESDNSASVTASDGTQSAGNVTMIHLSQNAQKGGSAWKSS